MPRALEAPREDRTLVHWLRRRVPDWQRLGDLLSEQRDRASESYAEVIELVDRFRSLGRDLSLARALLPGSALCRELENLFLKAHEAVFRRPTQLKAQLIELFRDEVPRVFHDMSATIWITVTLFFGTGLLGWLLVSFNPELASLFASEKMIEEVQRGELWTDGILNIVPSSVLSVQIMANNIIVSLFAFALGALYGLGTIYIISLNGFMLGGIFAFTAKYDMAGRLFNFVIAH
ncbi:MAG: stage II sporulation protein M, partial [Gammaproteobacteria bacterium]